MPTFAVIKKINYVNLLNFFIREPHRYIVYYDDESRITLL